MQIQNRPDDAKPADTIEEALNYFRQLAQRESGQISA
jgi:hypothetical protein